jgi:uncharacterized OB-fold protein
VRAPALSRPQAPSFLAGERCSSCGAWLAEDQEWCLECGAARTRIQVPPDWRIGAAIVIAVIGVIAIVVILAWQ